MKERLTAGKRVSSFFLMLSKLGTLRERERERRINPESLYISLCQCLSVSSGFVCTVANRNSKPKQKTKKTKTSRGQRPKR